VVFTVVSLVQMRAVNMYLPLGMVTVGVDTIRWEIRRL
jgi:hypothetical protein